MLSQEQGTDFYTSEKNVCLDGRIENSCLTYHVNTMRLMGCLHSNGGRELNMTAQK